MKNTFTLDTKKLRKVLLELIDDLNKCEDTPNGSGHLKGTGATIGKVGDYYISIDVDKFDSDDIATHTEVITEIKQ